MGEDPALPEALKLGLDMSWEVTTGRVGVHEFHEGRHVLLHGTVQLPVLGAAAAVSGRLRGRPAARSRRHPRANGKTRAVAPDRSPATSCFICEHPGCGMGVRLSSGFGTQPDTTGRSQLPFADAVGQEVGARA